MAFRVLGILTVALGTMVFTEVFAQAVRPRPRANPGAQTQPLNQQAPQLPAVRQMEAARSGQQGANQRPAFAQNDNAGEVANEENIYGRTCDAAGFGMGVTAGLPANTSSAFMGALQGPLNGIVTAGNCGSDGLVGYSMEARATFVQAAIVAADQINAGADARAAFIEGIAQAREADAATASFIVEELSRPGGCELIRL